MNRMPNFRLSEAEQARRARENTLSGRPRNAQAANDPDADFWRDNESNRGAHLNVPLLLCVVVLVAAAAALGFVVASWANPVGLIHSFLYTASALEVAGLSVGASILIAFIVIACDRIAHAGGAQQ